MAGRAGTGLDLDLDRVPLWKDDHVGVKELWSYYAQYLYLSRLRDSRVLAEAVQQVMRRHGVPDAYEKLKAISRGKRLVRRQLADFVRKLPIPPAEKKRLLALTPAKYTGLAAELARRI